MFLGWTPPDVSVGFEPGAISGDRLSSRISRAIAKALKDCDIDRASVAAQMSEKLGHKITKQMLEAYASEAKTGNNITVERFVALIHATGKTELLGFLADDFAMKVYPNKYANVVKLALIEDHQKTVDYHKKTIIAKIRGAS
ncbi:MAG: hypothetical protein K5905_22820 [Roseibium sp.]|nr:hypothetical protein [Roseibium sp.]